MQSPVVQQPLQTETVTAEIITVAKAKSNSRTNFAVNLVRNVFDERTRAKSNIAGVCNKEKLDTNKIEEIRRITFHLYPLQYGESELVAWKKCHVAIDESCRRLNKPQKK